MNVGVDFLAEVEGEWGWLEEKELYDSDNRKVVSRAAPLNRTFCVYRNDL